MAIHVHNKDITKIFVHNIAITTIYKGGQIVWQAVRSCFGGGMWKGNKPWLSNEKWKSA